jgi:hypothetical protein
MSSAVVARLWGESGAPKCFATCNVGADCRKGYACSNQLGAQICLPQ